MASWTFSLAITIGILAVLLHQLGVVDRPVFHDAPIPNMYAVVATCHEASYHEHIGRLFNTTLTFVVDEMSQGKERMVIAAKSYNKIPDDTKRVSVGLYIDNPSAIPNPRWAVGWVVQADSYEALQEEIPAIESNKQCGTLRAVRIQGGLYRQGRIPWRNMFTPMIAPMLHWGRAFEGVEDEHAVAMEIYTTSHHGDGDKEQETHEYIDYVVLTGADNTETMVQELFPTGNEESREKDVKG